MRIKPNADGHSCFWDSAFLYRWPVGQAVKTAASHAANGSSILPRVTTSEWTTFHSKSPAEWSWNSAFLYRWPVGQAVKTAASHAANGSSILPRVTTSEWTTFHSKSPAEWLGFSHTIPSFLLLPTKVCLAKFCGGPAAEEVDGSPDMRENIIADKARSTTGLLCFKWPPCFSTVMGAFC